MSELYPTALTVVYGRFEKESPTKAHELGKRAGTEILSNLNNSGPFYKTVDWPSAGVGARVSLLGNFPTQRQTREDDWLSIILTQEERVSNGILNVERLKAVYCGSKVEPFTFVDAFASKAVEDPGESLIDPEWELVEEPKAAALLLKFGIAAVSSEAALVLT